MAEKILRTQHTKDPMAMAVRLGSWGAAKSDKFAAWLVDPEQPVSNYQRVQWQNSGIPSKDIEYWAQFSAQKVSGRWRPRTFRAAGILSIEAVRYKDDQETYPNTEPAVAFPVGDTVMVGTLPKGSDFGEIGGTGRVAAAARIGRNGGLLAHMGLWDAAEGSLILPQEEPRVEGVVGLYELTGDPELDAAIAPGGMMLTYPGVPLV